MIKNITLLAIGSLMTGLFFALVTKGISNLLADKDIGIVQFNLSFFLLVPIVDCLRELLKEPQELKEVDVNGMKALVDGKNRVARLQCGEFEAVQHKVDKRPVLEYAGIGNYKKAEQPKEKSQ